MTDDAPNPVPSDSASAADLPVVSSPKPMPARESSWAPPTVTAGTPEPEPVTASGPPGLASDRPEVVVGGAFAGGLVLALILKRLAR